MAAHYNPYWKPYLTTNYLQYVSTIYNLQSTLHQNQLLRTNLWKEMA